MCVNFNIFTEDIFSFINLFIFILKIKTRSWLIVFFLGEILPQGTVIPPKILDRILFSPVSAHHCRVKKLVNCASIFQQQRFFLFPGCGWKTIDWSSNSKWRLDSRGSEKISRTKFEEFRDDPNYYYYLKHVQNVLFIIIWRKCLEIEFMWREIE